MADITIDLSATNPSFTPDPFKTTLIITKAIPKVTFTVAVTVSPGSPQPTLVATNVTIGLQNTANNTYTFSCSCSQAGNSTMTASTTVLGQEKMSSGTIEVSNPPTED
jgi:hypothetical protein